MFEFFKHITSKTKIILLGFMLILIPGAIISYISLESINQKAENLKVKYSGTVKLVRDKLESEVFSHEANLRNNLTELFPQSENHNELKEWLLNIESENPAFKHLFLVNSNGGIISSSVSKGWIKISESLPFKNLQAASNFNMAEKAEFIQKNYADAIRFYRNALALTSSSQKISLIRSRIGRSYYKSGKYKSGIHEYKKMLELDTKKINLSEIPASVIALSQIIDGYKALKDEQEQYNATINLYQQLLDHPWDLLGGEYLYYLKSAASEIQKLESSEIMTDLTLRNIQALNIKEKKLLELIGFIEVVQHHILSELESDFSLDIPLRLQSMLIPMEENNTSIQLGFFKLPLEFQESDLFASAYQFEKDYILSDLFPEILNTVELGKDVFVGILGKNDSLLYIRQKQSLSNYLVAENFSSLFKDWKVALFDKDGKSVDQLIGKEKQLYLILFIGIIIVMLIGIVIIVRAVYHETELSRMKSEFVSNVSHELKTPLALIRMFGETLDEGLVTDEKKRKEFYSIIRKESERLTQLINTVLDFSRMDSGVKQYRFEKTDLVKVVRDSLEAYKFHIRDNGFEIESEFPAEAIILNIEKDAIAQAILNLLSNAVKYSEDKKFILVKVFKDSGSAFISVTDRGVGIKKEELKKIFEKFYRISVTQEKQSRGNGLGLTLSKHIIQAHGGTIEVESEIGKGSTFTITIPLFSTNTK